MTDRLFRDRHDAGRVLASLLDHYRNRNDVIVLALSRRELGAIVERGDLRDNAVAILRGGAVLLGLRTDD